MRLPEFRDPRYVWLVAFMIVYLVAAFVLGAAFGTNAFFITMFVGSIVEAAWTIRLSLKRWN